MGLDCSHDAFHGAYSAFNRFRQAIAKAMGGSWPPHEDMSLNPEQWYWGDGYNEETHRGIFVLMSHSDCDGEISPKDCLLVAHDLESLLPKLDAMGDGGGHIARGGGYGSVARVFIVGCREAAETNEALLFA